MNSRVMSLVGVFVGCYLATGDAISQIRIREIVRDGTAVPGRDGVTFDGFSGFGGAAINGKDEVFFVNSRTGVTKWTPRGLEVPLPVLAEPPLLPPPPASLLNGDGNPFEKPRSGGGIRVLTGHDDSYYLEMRYDDVNDRGIPPRAWIVGHQGGLAFYSSSSSAVRGVAPDRGATMLSGLVGSGQDFTTLAGRLSVHGIVQPVLIEGDPAPLQDAGVTIARPLSNGMQWNSDGRILILTTLEGPGITHENASVLYREKKDLSGVEILAQQGQPHPPTPGLAPGGLIVNFGIAGVSYNIASDGSAMFLASITDPDDPNSVVSSMWKADAEGDPRFILRVGESLAVENASPITLTQITAPLICENGDIVFFGQWREGERFMIGLLRWQAANGSVSLELGKGGPVDGARAGMTMSSISQFLVSPSGRVAGLAVLDVPGVAGISECILVQRAAGDFYAVAVGGQSLELSSGVTLGTVSDVQFPSFAVRSNSADGKPIAFSKNGRLVFAARTSASSRDILLAADVDPGPALPFVPDAVSAGSAQSSEKPEGYDSTVMEERNRLEQLLATARDTSVPVDLSALTGLDDRNIQKLRRIRKFSGESREVAIAYLSAQLNVLRAIEASVLESPEIGVWLLDSFRSKRISFGANAASGPRSFAEINSDSSAECGREPITLKFIPCGDLAIYDPDFFQLVNSLLHEGLHAFQAFPPLAVPHTALEQAQWALDRHCHEIEASCEELDRTQELIRALLGQPSTRFAEAIVAQMEQDLAGAELEAARKRLLSRARRIRWNAQETKRCRGEYKDALSRFLATGGTAADGAQLKSELAQVNWFIEFRLTSTEFGEIGVSCGGATFSVASNTLMGDTSIRQLDTETGEETSFQVGFNPSYIYDGAGSGDASKFYVAAKIGTNGVILSYSDMDGDGLYDQSTEEEVISDPGLAGGALLSYEPSMNYLYAFNQISGYGIAINLSDKVTVPVGTLDLGADPILDLVAEDGLVEASPVLPDSAVTFDLRTRVAQIQEDGAIGSSEEFLRGTARKLAAVFTCAPVEGDAQVEVSGQPGSDVQLCRWSVDMLTNAGTTTLGSDGTGAISFTPPLSIADSLQLVTLPSGETSRRLDTLSLTEFEPRIAPVSAPSGDGRLVIEAIGMPGSEVSVDVSYDMNTWMNAGRFTLGGFGQRVVTLDSDPNDTEGLFGRTRTVDGN